MFLDVNILERRKMAFDDRFRPGTIEFSSSDWKQVGEIEASGSAELLDPQGVRTIRVRGRIRGAMGGTCDRCLDAVESRCNEDFDLFYYPMSVIARKEAISIDTSDTDLGFYEDPGLELTDVLKEQVLLWLPMRSVCREDCKGICSQCGANLNRGACVCVKSFSDPRWDALRKLQFHKPS